MNEPDDEIYRPSNVPLFEAIYGKDFISIGGKEAVELLFCGITLPGVKAIDLGFGIGGVAFYLAEKYKMQITGVEVHPWMAQHAQEHAPESVRERLLFTTYDNQGRIPVASQSQDLVYSKGVLNHVQDKAPLFQQVHSVLKPSGIFVIADWLFPQKMSAAYACETRSTYQNHLEESGFKEVQFRDDSTHFLVFIQRLVKNVTAKREFIEKNFGEKLFTEIWNQHQDLIEAINQKQKFATRIVAKNYA